MVSTAGDMTSMPCWSKVSMMARSAFGSKRCARFTVNASEPACRCHALEASDVYLYLFCSLRSGRYEILQEKIYEEGNVSRSTYFMQDQMSQYPCRGFSLVDELLCRPQGRRDRDPQCIEFPSSLCTCTIGEYSDMPITEHENRSKEGIVHRGEKGNASMAFTPAAKR